MFPLVRKRRSERNVAPSAGASTIRDVNHSSTFRSVGICLALLVLTLPAPAQLRLYDGLDYLGQLGGQGGGTNFEGATWANAWTAQGGAGLTNYSFVADSLAYESGEPLATSGNKGQGVAQRATRVPQHGVTEGTVYISFLINPLDDGNAHYAGFIGNQPTGSLPRVLCGIVEGNYAVGQWGATLANSANSGIPAANHRTDLVVVRYDLTNNAPDGVSLYVNPALPSNEPAIPDAFTNGFDILGANAAWFVSSHTDVLFQFDEIRYGTTWESVLPTGAVETEPFTEVLVSNVIGVVYQTAAGATYRLQYTTEPTDTDNWTTLPLQLVGDGTEMTVFDPGSLSTQKTYRIIGE